ncbi:MAG: dCTP deaminase [Candidatus Thermoplasmatota archaeon]|nr:dCTP deaminase [Candidatus Thermoplasmatota archaeon]
MQLSDEDLKVRMTEGKLKIVGFMEKNLTPNGYDLTIGEVLVPSLSSLHSEGTARISPKTWFLVSTMEFLELGPRLSGDLWIRTTWARRGIIPSFGKVDAGFKGNLTLSAFNASEEEIALPVGDTFAQITIHELGTPPSRTYPESSGTYQGQKGVTLSRSSGQGRSDPG